MSDDVEHITVYDGKYTLILDPSDLRALRNGEPWRDLCGDGFIMALGQEISDLRKQLTDISVAGRALYMAGRWSCDRPVEEAQLWSALRDALGMPPGTATAAGIAGEDMLS